LSVRIRIIEGVLLIAAALALLGLARPIGLITLGRPWAFVAGMVNGLMLGGGVALLVLGLADRPEGRREP